ncbi:MAG: aminoacyl-tRNA hydrolase [Bacilli bacterium]|nr:aminoacyl-tRNA hydrolase [Bacilli bacterium]MDD4076602.1 aminoacyl-tRNA hydrolase [Bacilli bacterium]MDD4387699.1 aminoacyl-tRNA hydrolase [Bacilli bacterium]
MKLIVGLGNPGRKYKKTRHNVGFMFVDQLAKDSRGKFTANRALRCEVAIIRFQEQNLIIIKPQTYMNLSGQAVLAVKDYYQIDIDNILIIYDDMELPCGKIRIRRSGSSGGHKGMKNIIDLLKTEGIKRIRIGIGKETAIDACNYVLSVFNKDETAALKSTTSKAKEMIDCYLSENFDNFMGKYN